MIIGFVGEQGEGKTAVMTYFLFLFYNLGKKIVCNHEVSFEHTKLTPDMFSSKEMITELNEMFENEVEGFCIGVDEIHLWLDSRNAMGNRKKAFLLTQARKSLLGKGIFFWTSQFLMQADIRLRMNTKTLIEVVKDENEKGTTFILNFFKKKGLYFVKYKTAKLNGNALFGLNLYDTYEIMALEDEL